MKQRSVAWLKPVAADLDGDGKQELAILVVLWYYYYGSSPGEYASAYFFMTFWSCPRGSIQPMFCGPDISIDTNGYFTHALNGREPFTPGSVNKKVNAPTTPYFPRFFSITAAPFRGKMGKYSTRDDVPLSYQANGSFVFNDVNLFLFWPDDDTFRDWTCEQSDVGTVSDSNTAGRAHGCGIGLATADFLREGAELGSAQHLVVSNRWTCSAIIQAPPYHFDTIPVPWETDKKIWPVNFNYEPASKTTYSRSGSNTDVKDTKFEATTSLEGVAPLNFEVSTKTMDTVKSAVKAVGTFALGTEAVGKFVGGDMVKNLTDKITATETKLTNESKTVGWSNIIEASKVDSQLFYTTRTHVWRYPVKPPVPAWLVGKQESGSEKARNGDFYITVVAPDQPITGSSKSLQSVKQGRYADNALYQPIHEEGNLFSYPTTLSRIPGYAARQFSLIPKVMPISYSPNQEKHKATVETSQGKLDVPMSLYYREAGSDKEGELIGTDTPKIGGWKPGSETMGTTDNNKAWAKFTWEKVPDLKQGAWEFYVVIDPEKKIEEVHEAWSKDDPTGNNTGYFPFGVSYGDEAISTKMTQGDFGVKYKTYGGKNVVARAVSLAEDEDHDEYEDGTPWTDWTNDTDLPKMVSGDTEFVLNIQNKYVATMNEAWFEVLMDTRDTGGEEDYTLNLAAEMLPVMSQGDDVTFSFILNEEEVMDGWNLRLVIADGEELVVFPLDKRTGGGSGGGGSSGCDAGITGAFALLALAGLAVRRRAK